MNDINFENLFDNITPPEGGVKGLREKLDRLERKRGYFSTPAFKLVSAFAILAVIAVGVSPLFNKPGEKIFFELAIQSGNPVFDNYDNQQNNNEVVSIPIRSRSKMAVMPVETGNKNVKFYLIESIAGDASD